MKKSTWTQTLAALALVGCAPDGPGPDSPPPSASAELTRSHAESIRQLDRLFDRQDDADRVVMSVGSRAWGPRYLAGPLTDASPAAPEQIARDALDALEGALIPDGTRDQLVLMESKADERTGYTHLTFAQVVGGHPVNAREMKVHVAPDGSVTAVHGRLEPGLTDVPPQYVPSNEVGSILEEIYGVEDGFEDFQAPQLGVSMRSGRPVLVWSTSIFARGFPTSLNVEVNATTGELHHEDAVGQPLTATGCDPFGNQRTIRVTHPLGMAFQLHDKSRPAKIRGYDQAQGLTWDQSTPLTDQDNLWCDANQAGAVAGHDNMGRVLDHFMTRHGRNSYNGSGGNIKMGFDAAFDADGDGQPDDPTASEENATSNGNGRFRFGDASGALLPFTTLDIVAHEFAHAVLSDEGVTYGAPRAARAVHEHVADMFGVFVEFDGGNAFDDSNWLIGEETRAVTGTPGNPTYSGSIRNLANPQANRDHVMDIGANDSAHRISQIPSFAVALAVGGGVHPESGVIVPSLAIEEARDIYYSAITDFMTAGNQSFRGLRIATLSAADAMFGSTSSQRRALEAGFNAVGITPDNFNLVKWADDYTTWTSGSTPVVFGSPQASPGVGTTSAIMEDGKPWDGEMIGMKPAAGFLGRISATFLVTLPGLTAPAPMPRMAPHLEAAIGFPQIAPASDSAVVSVRVLDNQGNELALSAFTASRDGVVDTVDLDLEAFAGMPVQVVITVANAGSVPERPLMFDTLRIKQRLHQ